MAEEAVCPFSNHLPPALSQRAFASEDDAVAGEFAVPLNAWKNVVRPTFAKVRLRRVGVVKRFEQGRHYCFKCRPRTLPTRLRETEIEAVKNWEVVFDQFEEVVGRRIFGQMLGKPCPDRAAAFLCFVSEIDETSSVKWVLMYPGSSR